MSLQAEAGAEAARSVTVAWHRKGRLMEGSRKEHRLIRFSMFELDLDSGELFKDGRTIKLQGQPFELLTFPVLDSPEWERFTGAFDER